jgi:hypothetical protein
VRFTSDSPSWFRNGLGWLFAAQLALLDLGLRGPAALIARPALAGGWVASVALMFLLERAFTGRLARAVVALGIASVIVTDLAYFRYYHAPFDAQVALAARHAWADVGPMLHRAAPTLAAGILFVACLEYAGLHWAEPPKLRRGLLGALVVGGLLVARSPRAATAEIRVGHALATLLTTRDARASTERLALPEIESERVELPDVLLLLTESVRASDACEVTGCATGPELDRVLPDRITLRKARALSSYTAIALSALTTGRSQLEPRSELTRAPDLFDLARAVRARGARYSVRYWSSQLAGVFERGELGGVADEVITADSLLGHPASDIEDSVAAGLDRRLGEQCERALPEMMGPRFVVVHLSGTHAPYFFDEARAPYQPWRQQVTWSGLGELHNAYLNALVEQDRTIARCTRTFLRTVHARPWLVIYTSDHGEAFGEHAAIHHGQNLYDEQLHVPWILAHGGGALEPSQAEALRAAANAAVTHLDFLPTLLDFWRLDRHVGLHRTMASLGGRSLLRPLGPLAPLPITNCTELFPCPLSTWGVLGETKKLIAQAWDGNWRCLSLGDGEQERDLAQCEDLLRASCAYFPRLPNGARNPGCGR